MNAAHTPFIETEGNMLFSQAAANGTWRDISEVSFAEGDRRLLANLIYCEAGGEPYVGQVAVGSVVINRVNRKHARRY